MKTFKSEYERGRNNGRWEMQQTLDSRLVRLALLEGAIADYGLMAVKQEDGTVRLEPTPEAELSANVVKAYTVDEKIDAIVRYLTED